MWITKNVNLKKCEFPKRVNFKKCKFQKMLKLKIRLFWGDFQTLCVVTDQTHLQLSFAKNDVNFSSFSLCIKTALNLCSQSQQLFHYHRKVFNLKLHSSSKSDENDEVWKKRANTSFIIIIANLIRKKDF